MSDAYSDRELHFLLMRSFVGKNEMTGIVGKCINQLASSEYSDHCQEYA